MRLWTIHPKYLDVKGLVALWREGLGAQRSLAAWVNGEPGVGYVNHPQLQRFKDRGKDHCGFYLNQYLGEVHEESIRRGYNFNLDRLFTFAVPPGFEEEIPEIPVNKGQVKYEWDWLQAKLQHRAPRVYLQNLDTVGQPKNRIHPLFHVVDGGVESWEKI